MRSDHRYAIYFLPHGPLADFGAEWLGWDVQGGGARGSATLDRLVPDRNALTETPRKYGFHATIKAPFHLADGVTPEALEDAVAKIAQTLRPVHLPNIEVAALGHFLALRPVLSSPALQDLAATVVRDLDPLRAPLSAADIARRRRAALTPAQDRLMLEWGYPYVFDEFRFHMTLSGAMPPDRITPVQSALTDALDPMLRQGLCIDDLAVVRERPDGRFECVSRIPLR